MLAVIITIWLYLADLQRQRAAEIRQSSRTLVYQSHRLSAQIIQGPALIYASSAITKELLSRLCLPTDKEEFWHSLRRDKDFFMSIIVGGYYSSPPMTQIRDTIDQMEQHELTWRGKLIILSLIVLMYKRVIEDGFSEKSFLRFFSAVRDSPDVFFQKDEKVESVYKLIDTLTMELQNWMSGYIIIRHFIVAKMLHIYTEELSNALLALEDSKLLKMSAAASRGTSATDNIIDNITLILTELEIYFPKKKYNRLLQMIEEIRRAAEKGNELIAALKDSEKSPEEVQSRLDEIFAETLK